MGRQAKEIFGVDKLKAVADRGYCNSTEIKPCDDVGIAVSYPAAFAFPSVVQFSAKSCRLQTEPARILALLFLRQVRDTRAQTPGTLPGSLLVS